MKDFIVLLAFTPLAILAGIIYLIGWHSAGERKKLIKKIKDRGHFTIWLK